LGKKKKPTGQKFWHVGFEAKRSDKAYVRKHLWPERVCRQQQQTASQQQQIWQEVRIGSSGYVGNETKSIPFALQKFDAG
jgi:hypothetical protein